MLILPELIRLPAFSLSIPRVLVPLFDTVIEPELLRLAPLSIPVLVEPEFDIVIRPPERLVIVEAITMPMLLDPVFSMLTVPELVRPSKIPWL